LRLLGEFVAVGPVERWAERCGAVEAHREEDGHMNKKKRKES